MLSSQMSPGQTQRVVRNLLTASCFGLPSKMQTSFPTGISSSFAGVMSLTLSPI